MKYPSPNPPNQGNHMPPHPQDIEKTASKLWIGCFACAYRLGGLAWDYPFKVRLLPRRFVLRPVRGRETKANDRATFQRLLDSLRLFQHCLQYQES